MSSVSLFVFQTLKFHCWAALNTAVQKYSTSASRKPLPSHRRLAFRYQYSCSQLWKPKNARTRMSSRIAFSGPTCYALLAIHMTR